MAYANLAVILLAAGEGRRFGGAKLEAELDGKMLGLHAAETVASLGFGHMVAVCNPANRALNEGLAALGFTLIENAEASLGQARSLALGVSSIADGGHAGALILLGDMPFVARAHIERLVEAFDAGARVVCSAQGETRMPPAIFSASRFQALQALSGGNGARALLAEATPVEGAPAMLRDIDRKADLQRR